MFDCVCPLPECRRLFPPLSSLLRGSKEGGERKKADNRKKRERERDVGTNLSLLFLLFAFLLFGCPFYLC